jgi:hypothetical protein
VSVRQIKIRGKPATVFRSPRGYVEVVCDGYVTLTCPPDAHKIKELPAAELEWRMDEIEAKAIRAARANAKRRAG